MCLAVPGRVIAVEQADGLPTAVIDYGGQTKQAGLALLPEVQVGDYVVVHLGMAIQRLDREAAEAARAELERLNRPSAD